MGFSRQEYWNGLPFPFPGDLPDPGIKSRSWALLADSLLTELRGKVPFRIFSSVQFSSVTQSCPTLCDHMDCSLPGSSVHEIFQARVLKWVAISFSRGSSQPRDQTCVSRISCVSGLQADSLPTEPPGKSRIYKETLVIQQLKNK